MITILAFTLLILRILATAKLYTVLKAQRHLMSRPIDAEITGFRRNLHLLTIALTVSNFPAIIMDIFFVIQGTGLLWTTVSTIPILIFYTASNAISALLAATLIANIYKDALKVDQSHADSDHTLMNDE